MDKKTVDSVVFALCLPTFLPYSVPGKNPGNKDSIGRHKPKHEEDSTEK